MTSFPSASLNDTLRTLGGPSAAAADADVWQRRHLAGTRPGSAWVSQVTDPYHDYNLVLQGVPDRNPSLSFLRQYKHRLTIAVPPGFGDYDAHIFFTPCLYQTPVADARRYPPNNVPGGTPTTLRYGTAGHSSCDFSVVTAIVVPSGQPTSSTSRLVFNLGPIATGALAMSPARVVSAGFEVHNTTAKLYEGGSVTVWKGNELRSTDFYEDANAAIIDVSIGAPSTVVLANALPNSRTWEASKGVYCVGQPDFSDLSFQTSRSHSFFTASGEDATNSWFFGFAGPVDPGSTVFPEHNVGYVPTGLVPSGAIFCGLNENSVLTADCRVVVEYCPSLSTADIALASPTAMYDAEAIATAAKIFDLLPPGVPVDFNGAGDWFRMVLRAGGQALQSVAGLIPHPVAKVAAAAGGRLIEHIAREREPRRVASAANNRMVHAPAPAPARRPATTPGAGPTQARSARRRAARR